MALSASAFAATLQTVAVKELTPGSVVATVRIPDEHPQPGAFSLNLASASGETRVAAQDVEPAGALPADLATTVLLAIDRSGSMHSAVPAIKAALKDVLASSRPDLRIGIVTFGSDVAPASPFFADSSRALEAVDAIRAETGHDGKTRLYDAISIAMSRLANDPSRGPKRLVVISDGKDEGSFTGRDALAGIVQQRAQTLDAIGFGPSAPKSSQGLAVLSKVTNGDFVLAANPAQLADAIRNDLGTSPAPAFDVSFRYPASNGSERVTTATLEYASTGSGASPVVLPVGVALAAPVAAPPPAPAVQVASPVREEAPPAVTPPVKKPPKEWSIRIGSIRVDLKLIVGLLIALAAALAFIAWRMRSPRPVPIEPAAPVPEPAARRVQRARTIAAYRFTAPAPGRPAAILLREGTARQAERFAIEAANVRVGSDESNDLVVNGDDFVSRKHANIRFDSGTLYLNDLGSSNGTFVNDKRLDKNAVALTPGDRVRVGRTTWVLRALDAVSPAGLREHERRVP